MNEFEYRFVRVYVNKIFIVHLQQQRDKVFIYAGIMVHIQYSILTTLWYYNITRLPL